MRKSTWVQLLKAKPEAIVEIVLHNGTAYRLAGAERHMVGEEAVTFSIESGVQACIPFEAISMIRYDYRVEGGRP